MTFDATALLAGSLVAVLYGLLTAALYYLGARATITRWLWSRYPMWLDGFMLCAACAGFWYGVAVALGIGWYLDVPYLWLPGRFWLTPIVSGLASMVVTPLVAARHLSALETTAPPAAPAHDHTPSADPDDDSDLEEQIAQEEAALKAAEDAVKSG